MSAFSLLMVFVTALSNSLTSAALQVNAHNITIHVYDSLSVLMGFFFLFVCVVGAVFFEQKRCCFNSA